MPESDREYTYAKAGLCSVLNLIFVISSLQSDV